MLDKSIPYKNIVMKLSAQRISRLESPVLPEGYSLRLFQPGDERHWARIETSVLEFSDEQRALDYFAQEFLPSLEELKRRCVFIADPKGLPVATATAWTAPAQANAPDGSILPGAPVWRPTLHWVSVSPDRQGLGLGKAVVQQALCLFSLLHPGEDVLLHTQTWSHVAVHLYHKLGFAMAKQLQFAASEGKWAPNDYEEALAVLKEVVEPAFLQELMDTAV